MAGENTIELGEVGDGAFCRKDLISWVFTPVLGSWSRGDAIFSFAARAHFCRAVIMWGGSIREKEYLIFDFYISGGSNVFACDEAYKL
jgi:hypothetical protein